MINHTVYMLQRDINRFVKEARDAEKRGDYEAALSNVTWRRSRLYSPITRTTP